MNRVFGECLAVAYRFLELVCWRGMVLPVESSR